MIRKLSKFFGAVGSLAVTLLFLLLIANWIDQQGPEFKDEQAFAAESVEFGSRDLIKERTALIRIGQQRQLDLAPFYFSIVPYYYPKRMHRILPLREREALTQWVESCQCATAALNFRQALKDLLERAQVKNKQLILRMLQEGDLDKLASLVPNDWTTELGSTGEAIQRQLKRLQNKKGHHFLIPPSFQWHGLRNQWHWGMQRFFSMKWGQSWVDGRPVTQKVGDALQWTLILNGLALILLFSCSIPLGIFWALQPDSRWVKWTRGLSYLLAVAPLFWVATLSISFLTGPPGISLFPYPLASDYNGIDPWILILPLLCILASGLSYLSRMSEDSMRKELDQPYVRFAIHRGIPANKVIWRYALPNALLPMITIAGGALPTLVSGSLVIEVLFNIPGMGRMIWWSLLEGDWPVVSIVILLVGLLTWGGRAGADALSRFMDPRVLAKEGN